MKPIKFVNKHIFDFKAIIHYLLIYLMLACGGTAWSGFVGNDLFVMIIFFLPLFLMVMRKKIESSFLIMFASYTLFCIFAMLYSSLSIGTYMNIGGKLLITYVVLCYDREKFLERFLKLSVFLGVISLTIFSITQVVGFNNFASIYTRLYTDASGGNYDSGNGYGLVFYRFVPLHNERNCGMFTEPGEHAIFLNVVLYFLTVHANKEKFAYRNFALVIVVLNLITCQSTAGYFMMLLIVLLMLFSQRIHFQFNMRVWIGIIFVIYIFRDYLLSLFQSVVIEKITENGMIDLTQGTASARYSSIKSVLSYLGANPKSVFGIGFEGIQNAGIGSCAGLLAVLMAVGIFAFSAIYVYMIGSSLVGKKDIFDFLMQMSIILIAGLSQPATAFPVVFILSMYSALKKKMKFFVSTK